MRMMSVVLVVICFAAPLFAGGSSESEENSVVEIDFWYSAAEGDENDVVYRFNRENVELFEQMNPNVRINTFVLGGVGGMEYRDKLVTEAASGSIPDVFMTWHGAVTEPLVDAGLLLPIDSIIADDPDLSRTIDRSKLSLATYDGVIYGIPDTIDVIGFFYNKAIFEEFGVSIPETFDEFVAAAETFRDNGVKPIGLGLNPTVWLSAVPWQYIFMQQNPNDVYVRDIVEGEWDFTDSAYIESMETYQQMALNGFFGEYFNSISAGETRAEFLRGESAMLLFGTWGLPALSEGLGDDLGFMTIPSIDGAEPAYMIAASKGYAIGADAPQEAIDFFRFIYSPERQARYAEMGVFVTPVGLDYDASALPPTLNEISAMLDSSKNTFVIWNDFLSEGVKTELFPAIQDILNGGDVEELLTRVQESKDLLAN